MNLVNFPSIQRCGIFVGCLFAILSCRSVSSVDSAPEGAAEVQASSDMNQCKKVPHSSSHAEITWMYHWTNNPLALSDPLAYLRQSIAQAIKRNQSGNLGAGDSRGAGIYLASDPFSSILYGNILVRVPIKANLIVGDYEKVHRGQEASFFKRGCPAAMYLWGYQGDTFSFGKDRALVIYSMDAVETKLAHVSSLKRRDEKVEPGPQESQSQVTDLASLFALRSASEVGVATEVAQDLFFSAPQRDQAEETFVARRFKDFFCHNKNKNATTASDLDAAIQAFHKVPKFEQWLDFARQRSAGELFVEPDKLDWEICQFIWNEIYDWSVPETAFPANEIKLYLGAKGWDIGSPTPSREALRAQLKKRYMDLPETRAAIKLGEFIANYLKSEIKNSIDNWQ